MWKVYREMAQMEIRGYIENPYLELKNEGDRKNKF